MIKSVFTRVKDLVIHARVCETRAQGNAPIVVLVHGLGVSGRYMMPTAERLVEFARVYVPDLPGFGHSDKPPRSLTIAELTDYLAAWMDVMKITRAVFAGNSFGTQIIVELALRYPSRVEKAMLIAPTVDRHARQFSRQIFRLLIDAPREPLSLVPIALGDYFRAGLKRAARTLRYALDDRIEEKLPRIKTPLLIVRGGRDPIVPQGWAKEITRLSNGARLEIIPQAAHAVNYNSPEELARLLISFVNENYAPER